MIYKIDELRHVIQGHEMDAGVGALQIDCREWLAKHPHLKNYRIEVMPPTGDFYFAVTTMEDGILTWHLSQADTLAAGDGRFQVVAIGDNGERKTSDHPVMSVVDIIPGTANENPPEGFEVWADEVAQAAATAVQSLDRAEEIEKRTIAQGDQIQIARDETVNNAIASAEDAKAAAESADIAQDNAQIAVLAADHAEQIASQQGYVFIDINEVGELIMTKTANVEGLDFNLNDDGELEVIYG